MPAPTTTIPVLALVSAGEEATVAKACDLIGEALSEEFGQAWTVTCDLIENAHGLHEVTGPAVLVTSMVSEVDSAEPWPEVAARLRALYEAFGDRPEIVVFICTAFRHVARDLPAAEIAARRLRIRRLNALALELSRELGVMIADVDRDLTDLGAQVYDTDYRLQGSYAAAAVGKSIALAVLHIGLDEFAPFELQEAARARVQTYQPPQATALAPIPQRIGGAVGAVRVKKRVQVVEFAESAAEEAAVASQFKRLLSGEVSPLAAVNILITSIGNRGLKHAFARLFTGLRKAVSDGRPARP